MTLSNEAPHGGLLVSLMAGAEHQIEQATISNLELSVPLPILQGREGVEMESILDCAYLVRPLKNH